MKIFFSIFLTFFCIAQVNCHEREYYTGAVNRFVDFINRISHGEEFAQYEVAATLISPDCRKIFNGGICIQGRDTIISDLLLVHKNHGSWTISPADTIISSGDQTVVLRLFIDMEKFGIFNAIVILRYDSHGLVTEINEVFNRVEGTYSFEGVNK